MATFYSAKNAKVRFGSAGSSTTSYTLTAKRWRVTPRNPAINTTNFESGGNKEVIASINEYDVEITLDDDGAANMFDLGIKAGQFVSLKLFLNGTAGPYWLFYNFYIESPSQEADVSAAMGDTISGTGSGTVTYPTGNAA
jgi:hypothetical protein